MAKKKVLISVGPIPARLDSVKFITNRFKGGLAIKTANYLADKGMELTVVAWKFTDVTGLRSEAQVVRVLDVYEYCNYIKEHAKEFDAFVMAAAVANLSPTHPYEDKFPSHLYKVGDKFNIEFEIAPRAIDIVKQVNPRCCLIGYKLFDAKTDEELIEIARHTLHDSKANIIFANTPKDAKVRKLALMQDNSVLELTFDEHLQLMEDAINAAYFKTEVDATIFDDMPAGKLNKIMMCKKLVKLFESTLSDNFGTIAIKVSTDNDFVTTARGHKGEPVYVKSLDRVGGVIVAEAKATLNVPALMAFMTTGYDYVIHRHDTSYSGINGDGSDVNTLSNYIFPGTIVEFVETRRELLGDTSKSCLMQKGHGYLAGFMVRDLSWDKYYNIFGDAYSRYPEEIDKLVEGTDIEDWLDVGANTHTTAKYVLDPYVQPRDGAVNLHYGDKMQSRFSLITLKNCINYLEIWQLDELIKWLKPSGVLIANSFVSAPNYRVKGKEATYLEDGEVNHYYMVSEQEVYYNLFKNTNMELLEDKGFTLERYNEGKSVLIKYIKAD